MTCKMQEQNNRAADPEQKNMFKITSQINKKLIGFTARACSALAGTFFT